MSKAKNNELKSQPVCVFCKSSEDDDLRFGKFYRSKELSVHNFCLLFSSGLSQNGKNDNDGYAGFLSKDIKKEIARGRRLKCSYCRRAGATIGCCKPACKKVFHFNCGLQHNSLHLFYGSFASYCSSHKAKPIYPADELPTKEIFCAICYNTVSLQNYDTTVWTSCCRNGWFHKPCIQRQAFSAGYFSRCPLCNNTEKFQKQMLLHGIYIPQQDAAWELEENAFQELLFRHEQCDASCCNCPKGRKYNRNTSQWRLVLCEDCGSQGRHVGCESSITPKFTWKCQACVEITEKLKSKKTEFTVKKVQVQKVKNVLKREPQVLHDRRRTLRSTSRNNSTESAASIKDEISSTSEKPDESNPTNSNVLCEVGPSFDPSVNHRNYSIVMITKSEPLEKVENIASQKSEIDDDDISLQDLKASIIGNESEPETKMSADNLKIRDHITSSEEEGDIDPLSDMVSSVPRRNTDYDSCESENVLQDAENDLKQGLIVPFLSHSSTDNDDDSECSASDIFLDNKSVGSYNNSCEIPYVKNVKDPAKKARKLCGDSSLIRTKDCKNAVAISGDEENKHYGLITDPVNCKSVLAEKITEDDITYQPKKSFEIVSKEIPAVKSDLSQVSPSSCNFPRTHKKHSKRSCTDLEENLPKKQKLALPPVPCNRVIILSITPRRDHEHATNPTCKTIGEISLPTASSNSLASNSQRVEAKLKECHDAENVLRRKKSPIIMNICSTSENEHREPLVKLGAPNRLVQDTIKIECTSGNCGMFHSSVQCSKTNLEYENRVAKKQKLNNSLSKRGFGTRFKYKNDYLCIKALFGRPCDCCKEKTVLSKKQNGKGNPCKKSRRAKYDIDFIMSGSSNDKLDEKSLGNKHSCNLPPNYVVNVLKSGSAVREANEKLSAKPQVIHLKNVSH